MESQIRFFAGLICGNGPVVGFNGAVKLLVIKILLRIFRTHFHVPVPQGLVLGCLPALFQDIHGFHIHFLVRIDLAQLQIDVHILRIQLHCLKKRLDGLIKLLLAQILFCQGHLLPDLGILFFCRFLLSAAPCTENSKGQQKEKRPFYFCTH